MIKPKAFSQEPICMITQHEAYILRLVFNQISQRVDVNAPLELGPLDQLNALSLGYKIGCKELQ